VGGSWVVTQLGAAGAYGGKNSIALRPNGNPVVSYEQHGVGYFWTGWTGTTWTGPTAISDPEPSSAPGDNGIGVDPLTGTVRGAMALWKSSGTGSGSLLGIWNSQTSTATIVDGPNMDGIYVGATGTQTSATVDKTGRLHVAYQFQVGFGTRFLKYGKLESGAWTAAVLDSMTGDESGGNAYFSSVTAIAADGTGAPGIVYTGSPSGAYKYARWNGSAWATSVIDASGGRGQSLAYDRNNNPHVALCQSSYKLTYAHLVGSTWVKETVDPSEGLSCSIGVDGSGKVYISYYDETLQRLRLAVRTP
jgi:hypothetical protein